MDSHTKSTKVRKNISETFVSFVSFVVKHFFHMLAAGTDNFETLSFY